MVRLALALDPATEDRLIADAVEHGHAIVARLVGWRDVLENLDVLAPDVVLVGAGRATLSGELLAGCDDRGIRLIALAAADADRAHAAQLGLHEVLDRSAHWTAIDAFVRGGVPVPSRLGDPEPRAQRAAEVIAVWGPAGAPGRTTIAVNLAAEFAAAGHSVALVDADPYGGAIAPALGLLDEAPGLASACRLAGGDALDRAELERIAQRYSAPRASFDVFTGLVGPSRWPELAHDRVMAAIRAIAARVEYVVIDTGFSLERDEELTSDQFAPRRNAATFAAISAADRVVAVGLADPVGLSRLLRGHGDLLEHVEPERVDVIVNRVRTAALGIDAHAQVRQTLRRFAGIGDATLLPHDGRATDAAILTARTLRDAAPRSPLRAALREYALDRILPVPQPARRRRSAFPAVRRAAAG
ncbi:MinD-like ATPase involved in chromosome partitioning or flagellar assembly [Agromyces ramosus]|uniref:MinD-like ATPase involved in chromosome partitioning or flagellar assembly n=1 Tax=Agromyces ramosus TaxID=33879 RepID=A0A4Q7MI31_9MICO|nr:P-loop NTPase [Agromyces ramosus]RZS67874.1 MinD-like ATPase involved in chromosome partitioning or flagellar assembly [Agromyces ramosus]